MSQELRLLGATIHPLHAEQLYLWSSNDPLTEAEHIEEIIEMQKKRGIICFSYDFKDSTHVGHFRNYPQEYVGFVQNFVSKVIEQKKIRKWV